MAQPRSYMLAQCIHYYQLRHPDYNRSHIIELLLTNTHRLPYDGSMKEQPDPQELVLVKVEEVNLMMNLLYARDREGNIWRTLQDNGRLGEWRLFMKAKDVPRPTLTFDKIVNSSKST